MRRLDRKRVVEWSKGLGASSVPTARSRGLGGDLRSSTVDSPKEVDSSVTRVGAGKSEGGDSPEVRAMLERVGRSKVGASRFGSDSGLDGVARGPCSRSCSRGLSPKFGIGSRSKLESVENRLIEGPMGSDRGVRSRSTQTGTWSEVGLGSDREVRGSDFDLFTDRRGSFRGWAQARRFLRLEKTGSKGAIGNGWSENGVLRGGPGA